MESGVVATFDADKGFGFIRPSGRGWTEDVFVHVTDIPGRKPLSAGQTVTFEVEQTDRGWRARKVNPGRRGLPPGTAAALGLGLALGAVAYGLHRLGLGWIGAGLAGWNLVTFAVYGWDKRRAGVEGARRVPEANLLALALLGGSPGAAAAMYAFRHKTRKASFLIPFAGIVGLQIVLIAYWFFGKSM